MERVGGLDALLSLLLKNALPGHNLTRCRQCRGGMQATQGDLLSGVHKHGARPRLRSREPDQLPSARR